MTSEPSPLTVFATFTNGIVFALVVDTDAPDTSIDEAQNSKVRVMGGSKLSSEFTIVPATFPTTPAALEGIC